LVDCLSTIGTKSAYNEERAASGEWLAFQKQNREQLVASGKRLELKQAASS
jgi:hypothetical protein